jgi:hypothetical protein
MLLQKRPNGLLPDRLFEFVSASLLGLQDTFYKIRSVPITKSRYDGKMVQRETVRYSFDYTVRVVYERLCHDRVRRGVDDGDIGGCFYIRQILSRVMVVG